MMALRHFATVHMDMIWIIWILESLKNLRKVEQYVDDVHIKLAIKSLALLGCRLNVTNKCEISCLLCTC